jgi:hypothetical protein
MFPIYETSLKNDMDWSDHFETHKLDMLLESDEHKNKDGKFVNIHEVFLIIRL